MKQRSAVELMVIMFTATVCLSLLLIGGAVAVIVVVNPDEDVSGAVNALTHALSVLMGALLGLLAGRSDSLMTMLSRRQRRDGEE